MNIKENFYLNKYTSIFCQQKLVFCFYFHGVYYVTLPLSSKIPQGQINRPKRESERFFRRKE